MRIGFSYDGNVFGDESIVHQWRELRVRFFLDRGEPDCEVTGPECPDYSLLNPFGPWIGINELERLLTGQETAPSEIRTYLRSILGFMSDHKDKMHKMFAREKLRQTIALILDERNKAIERFRNHDPGNNC